MKVEAKFVLEMDDSYYQHLLEEIENEGGYILPIAGGIRVTKEE